jgi:hypothetical protein
LIFFHFEAFWGELGNRAPNDPFWGEFDHFGVTFPNLGGQVVFAKKESW